MVRERRVEFTLLDAVEVALVVEIVSPGSVAVDRAIKPRLYAEAGIPCYARIDLVGPTVILRHLDGDQYELAPAEPSLRMREPFPVDLDLAALLAADRPFG